MLFDFSDFYQIIAKNRLSHWLNTLPTQLTVWQKEHPHGQLPRWIKMLNKIPTTAPSSAELKDEVRIGESGELERGQSEKLENLLQHFHPWRKGPYQVHGIHIDTEWRSDWKWDRVLPHISPLKGRYVLDVGCGNGYHMWRMVGQEAEMVVGIDPSELFLIQFSAIKRLLGNDQRAHLLPLGIEQLPKLQCFDTVFSMGVLYHRRSPIDHLIQLKNQLTKGGELVLETLVIDGDEQDVLVPTDRYGQMRNVWFFPSAKALKLWLEKCGFVDVKIVDETETSLAEQRSTSWMRHQSLEDYLDPNDKSKTIEGYPAPKRAILIAKNPD
ncbi:tRNA 5-methoxyuridine(34)/uridine 5-oxyacetic acid(34) synthase CmoB [Vibrio sp. SS-MA-C1-2]|uniref:tRNA 5-methoxyuridine(34)/uridine 5-oxyacetic acid(34) synthase CmoB n=1 Tax=Vibrio sp. SS-MA-C1-2 TaxID=2908646 RepID=UPI001F34D652|nr:tRNA 5-methoxyuridine(34)/uridine 5-oxyacetic acid(34) synthase CmoB [Vibrio sp. SS-MA-C1-2]UJF18633.1 tRNA 5-methoxyuridine(34)/uridine 5-oxyacetic acid(34) synthase CmoB [Vibrio sp. SS-MA-C1-2]